MHSNKIIWLALVSALIGFLDAVYLSAKHLSGVIPPCTMKGGCEEVLSSSYASIGPVPIALLGAIYYASAFFLVIGFIDKRDTNLLYAMSIIGFVGIMASTFLIYLQLGPLDSICPYCMLSAACCFLYGTVAIWLAKTTYGVKS